MLYNTLYNLKKVIYDIRSHHDNRFVFPRGIYNVLYIYILLHNMLCNKKCAT